jgi:hypothetical protein
MQYNKQAGDDQGTQQGTPEKSPALDILFDNFNSFLPLGTTRFLIRSSGKGARS